MTNTKELLQEMKTSEEALTCLNNFYKKGLQQISEVVIPTSVKFILTLGEYPSFLCAFPAKKGLIDCWNQSISEVITEFSAEYFSLSSPPSQEEIEDTISDIYKKGLPVIVDEVKVNDLIESFGDLVQWDSDDISDCSRAIAMYISGLNPSSKNEDVQRIIMSSNFSEVEDQIRIYTEMYNENDLLITKFLADNNISAKIIYEDESPYDSYFQVEKIKEGLKKNNITVKSYVIDIRGRKITIKNISNFEIRSKLKDLKELIDSASYLNDVINKKIPVFYNNKHKVFFDKNMKVPRNWAGFCIGRGGENVKKLSSIFGYRVDIIVTNDIIDNNNIKFSLKFM